MKTLLALLTLTATAQAAVINYSGEKELVAVVGYNDADQELVYAWTWIDYDLSFETDSNGHEIRLLGTLDIYTLPGRSTLPEIERHYDFLDTPGRSMTRTRDRFGKFIIAEDGKSMEVVDAGFQDIYRGNKNGWTEGRGPLESGFGHVLGQPFPANVSFWLGRGESDVINIGTNLHPMTLDPDNPSFERWGLMPMPFGIVPEPTGLALCLVGIGLLQLRHR